MNSKIPQPRQVKIPGTPLVLLVLDGIGAANERSEFSAVSLARTPNLDALSREYPSFVLWTSGEAVGLPEGQMGNSEVGHGTIGAGRVVYQPLVRVSKAIGSGEFFKNKALLEAMDHSVYFDSTLHLVGLVSDGGIHSHIDHLFGLIDLAKRKGVKKVAVHVITDGRDTDPKCAEGYVDALEKKLRDAGVGVIASVGGRLHAMDRDRRMERTAAGLAPLLKGEGVRVRSALQAVRDGYGRGEVDETLKPCVVVNQDNQPVGGVLKKDDTVLFFNFRDDRMRQPVELVKESGVPVHVVTMTKYEVPYDLPVVFPPTPVEETLGEVLSKSGLRVLRLAETEKFAHVTFFFDSGREEPFSGTSQLLSPSTRQVPAYDMAPRMNADEVSDYAVKAIGSGNYDVVVMNIANGDMVGHTGKLRAAVLAVEAADEAVGKVVSAARKVGGTVLIVADHGNAEQMIDYGTGSPHTQHTSGPVRAILVSEKVERRRQSGGLSDVAPTMLELLEVPKPPAMTGESMVRKPRKVMA